VLKFKCKTPVPKG